MAERWPPTTVELAKDLFERAGGCSDANLYHAADRLRELLARAQAAEEALAEAVWTLPVGEGEKVGTDTSPCDKCGRPMMICWWAESDLWNRVNGSPNGFLCPPCFDRAAAQMGLYLTWQASRPGEKEPTAHEAAEAEYQLRRSAEAQRDELIEAVREHRENAMIYCGPFEPYKSESSGTKDQKLYATLDSIQGKEGG